MNNEKQILVLIGLEQVERDTRRVSVTSEKVCIHIINTLNIRSTVCVKCHLLEAPDGSVA